MCSEFTGNQYEYYGGIQHHKLFCKKQVLWHPHNQQKHFQITTNLHWGKFHISVTHTPKQLLHYWWKRKGWVGDILKHSEIIFQKYFLNRAYNWQASNSTYLVITTLNTTNNEDILSTLSSEIPQHIWINKYPLHQCLLINLPIALIKIFLLKRSDSLNTYTHLQPWPHSHLLTSSTTRYAPCFLIMIVDITLRS